MAKILESLGVIDGYDIIEIGKIRIKKDKLFEEIITIDKKIQEEAKEVVISSKGKVFAITKDNLIKGIYLFKEEIKEDNKNLILEKVVYTKEVPEDVKERYNEHILIQAKELVKMQEYDKITLKDKVVENSPKKSKKERNIALACGFLTGFIFGWIVFDDIVFGILYAVILGPLFSGLDVVVTNKRGRKKK